MRHSTILTPEEADQFGACLDEILAALCRGDAEPAAAVKRGQAILAGAQRRQDRDFPDLLPDPFADGGLVDDATAYELGQLSGEE